MQLTKVTLTLALLGPLACVESQEVLPLEVPVRVDSSGLVPSTNELGWMVELSACHMAIDGLEFTTEGEAHTGLGDHLLRLIARPALAHPGHLAGGEVIGELHGNYEIDWLHEDGRELGRGALLPGEYTGVNMGFATSPGPPLDGHTAYLAGTATKGADVIVFTARLALDLEVRVIGGSFEAELTPGDEVEVALQLLTVDPVENDTLFQLLDFGLLDADGDGSLTMAPEDTGHNILKRTLQSHDHYRAQIVR